ncbi:hypothetical protein PCA20602_03858 [Pandoraea capi]|uniref:DUF1640 domain-containing protein n=3 Tax=Burkholderiaceae TaxID=119060 RepID=A0ABY6W777_9BURK|nr:hypothetical protein PCA20602_03858 [Pandoraea capi]
MRQKVVMKMGTLRKIDSRFTRLKVSHTDTKSRHDEMRLQARIASVEAILPTLATKEDLAKEIGTLRAEMHQEVGGLRSEMHKEFATVHRELHALTWRLIGTMVTLGTALVAATHFVSKAG